MSELEKTVVDETKKVEKVERIKTPNEIAMEALCEALSKCGPGDIIARDDILQAMKKISDNEKQGSFVPTPFERKAKIVGDFVKSWEVWYYLAIGGTLAARSLAKLFKKLKK